MILRYSDQDYQSCNSCHVNLTSVEKDKIRSRKFNTFEMTKFWRDSSHVNLTPA